MAVTAASPQNCLKNQAASTLMPPRRKNRRRVSEQKPAGRGKPDYQSEGPGRSPTGGKYVNTGQIRILKRGEKLNEITATELPIDAAAALQPRRDSDSNSYSYGVVADSNSYGVVADSNSYGVVEKLYAGTSFFTVSPPPSSVPTPMFWLTKKVALTAG